MYNVTCWWALIFYYSSVIMHHPYIIVLHYVYADVSIGYVPTSRITGLVCVRIWNFDSCWQISLVSTHFLFWHLNKNTSVSIVCSMITWWSFWNFSFWIFSFHVFYHECDGASFHICVLCIPLNSVLLLQPFLPNPSWGLVSLASSKIQNKVVFYVEDIYNQDFFFFLAFLFRLLKFC